MTEEHSILELIKAKITSQSAFEDDSQLETIIKESYEIVESEPIDPLSMAFYTELSRSFIDLEYLYFQNGMIKTPLGLVVGKLDVPIELRDTRAIINCRATASKVGRKKKTLKTKNTPMIARKTVEELRQQVDFLKSIKSPEQRSEAWYAARHTRLTASDLAGAIGESKYDTRFDILKKKVLTGGASFTGNFATRWGQKFEDVAVQIYCSRYREEVLEFGMIQHPTIPFLGASPDGIIERTGTMLEIKCPVSRVIDGSIPRHYEIQMQLQLEVCDLELCHFLECKFSQYDHERLYWADGSDSQTASSLEKGILIEALNKDVPEKYLYCPLGSDRQAVDKWTQESFEKLSQELPQTKPIVRYWRLEQLSCVAVHRDRDWFNHVLPLISSFWHEVSYYRTQPPEQLYRDYRKVMPCTIDCVDEDGNPGTHLANFLSDSDCADNCVITKSDYLSDSDVECK